MSDQPLSVLADAIERDDPQAAAEQFDAVLDEFSARRQETEAIDRVAHAVRTQSTPDDQTAATIETFAERAGDAGENRLEMNEAVVEYLVGELDAEEAAAAVRESIDTEDQLSESITAVSAIDTAVDLAPILALTGPTELEVPRGTQVTDSVTIRNYGDEPATDVSIDAESELSLDVSPSTIDAIEPDEERTIELTGNPTQAGRHEVIVEAAVDTDRSSQSVAVAVATKRHYLEASREQVVDLLELVEEIQEEELETEPPGRGNGLNGVINKLETARDRLDELLDELDQLDDPTADEEITGIRNLVETIPKQVRGFAGVQVSENYAALIAADAESVSATLDSATDAN